MHSKKQDKNTVRHIGIHKNEELLESELPQIPIDGSFQIVKEHKKGVRPLFPEKFSSLARAADSGSEPWVFLVELTGIEPVTSCLQSRRSPS